MHGDFCVWSEIATGKMILTSTYHRAWVAQAYLETRSYYWFSYWYFLISSSPWQFLTRCKKNHAISIITECVRSPRVQTFCWHSSNRESRPGEFQPYLLQLVDLASVIWNSILTAMSSSKSYMSLNSLSVPSLDDTIHVFSFFSVPMIIM